MARVIAVEDNPADLALIASLMTEFGHTPITAADAETGLRLIGEQHPDLVLCDIRLPKLSGYDVVQRLRSDPATRQLPVIAVTAVGDKEEAMQAGFDGFLAKPLSLARLRSEIERLLPASVESDRASPAKAPRRSGARVKTVLPRTGKRILVLDNTEANRELMTVVLDYGGHDVVCARSVAGALAVARSWRPHLVLCDVHLDKELGTELLSAIRSTPELRGTVFAFSSASCDPSIAPDLLRTGANAFLRLPMKPNVLLTRVGELLAAEN